MLLGHPGRAVSRERKGTHDFCEVERRLELFRLGEIGEEPDHFPVVRDVAFVEGLHDAGKSVAHVLRLTRELFRVIVVELFLEYGDPFARSCFRRFATCLRRVRIGLCIDDGDGRD